MVCDNLKVSEHALTSIFDILNTAKSTGTKECVSESQVNSDGNATGHAQINCYRFEALDVVQDNHILNAIDIVSLSIALLPQNIG